MTSKTLVPRRASSTGRDLDPPAQMQRAARERLAVLTKVLSALVVVAAAMWLLGFTDTVALPVHAAVLLVSAGLYFATRTQRLTDAQVVQVGLLAEVAYCAVIALPTCYLDYRAHGHFRELTWVCITIVIFPLLAPSRPRRTLLAGFASAATAPLGVWTTGLLLDFTPTLQDFVRLSLSPSFCVVLSYVGAATLHRLGLDVARAQELGAYRLERRIGRGGMGEVWLARHRMLARPAALKLIQPEGDGPGEEALRRFEREAQATASLRSPHTVELYDFGTTDDGTLYYAMEFLDGLDVAEMVRAHGPIGAARTVHLLRQACHSLGEAHDAGLVHRDIKPANLFVCRQGLDADILRVLDFGLVALQQRDPHGDVDLTDPGKVIGTPAYIAPESAERGIADARSDIYSLGCTAFYMLTGEPVFRGDSAMEVIVAHVTRAPDRVSARVDDIPRELDDLVASSLAKDPALRPESVAEFDAALADVEARLGDGRWSNRDAHAWWDAHPSGESPSAA